ncbi:septal ring lytic transglycosylase RlpA family protein [Arenimonas sp.]|uniref:septal ring lytic transglycosylase RlpA family protein n=1 Tax=Arenimonas sp. TaxID=1872635 RepID=UPI0039E44F35
MRFVVALLLCAGLAACGHAPKRTGPAPVSSAPAIRPAPSTSKAIGANEERAAINHCLPTRQHDERDYTAGGLYAPGVADAGPAGEVDISGVAEPVPRDEPKSRYGNRSPYTVLGKNYYVRESARGYSERGVASWYGAKFNGRSTSSGEIYDMCAFTAAHKTLPLPSFVRVTNLDNGRSLIVRVNDRGPFHAGRVIDLSYAAAVRLGVDRTGTARVELRAITGDGETEAPATASTSLTNASARAAVRQDAGDAERRWLQLGSFAEKDNAQRLVDRLDDAGIEDADIDRAEVGGRDVWRVRIGPLSLSEIESLAERIRQLGLPSPRVFSE